MSATKFIGGAAAVALLAAGLTALSGAAARAQESDQQPTMFGYAAPHQYLVNRMMAPDQPGSDDDGAPAAGQGATGGHAANGGQAAVENVAGNGYYHFPKRYLLNKMFDLGGGDSAPAAAPAAPAPTAAASAPAAKTP